MSRDVTRRDVQDAISTLRAWANGSGYLEEPKSVDLLRACAETVEALLSYPSDKEGT